MRINFKMPIAAQAYNNVAAHNEVLAMMKRGERLAIFFAVDKYGYEIVRVESRTTKRFSYQLTAEALTWLLRYLIEGKTEDAGVDPVNPKLADTDSSNHYRKEMLMEFVKAKIGNLQTLPSFLDRVGRLTCTASFKNGTVLFFTDRDAELVEFMQEHRLIG